ncbi:MAG: isoleucine--tRNA ligase, partial [Eubacteriales bacterium]|nr:isoleucine--tRNA ligase [Eubacteriales bacterium]
GWDTHGLPVEIQVEKDLGMNGKQDIEKYGIKEFNQKCRESVFKFTGMWRDMSERMAYLADMDHPYITLDNNYIESVWWIIKQFYDAGMIYEGHKVQAYCPRCGTGLASHEVAQGYKSVKVNALTVKFKVFGKPNEYFLAWTTTPWTLAANVALTVGPDITYVKARMLEGDEKGNMFYVAKNLADKVLGEGKYKVLLEVQGRDLEHLKYEKLMPWTDVPEDQAFFVTCMDYVSTEDGTGIVHTAPAFGEDDYNCGLKYGLPVYKPVDEKGQYTTTPWKGHFIMEEGLDVEIIKWLSKEGKLFAKQKIEHDYPHCWRCGTPLIYYARPGWYIRMSDLRDELVANNNTVNWFPPFVGKGRFGNWLADVRDWNISRSRYWGTPIPIWKCECGHLESCGSRAELAEKAIEDVDPNTVELHRPYVDDIHFCCPKCGGTMSRIPEVMDCWFDSGSMPYAQWHYPFEHKDDFDQLFPADFICEGIDQTRGWFYSLMAISTFLRHQAPYKNVLVSDLILDKNGKKMSKSKGNTVSPFEMLDKYGADATRWYLMSVSPAWTPTKFDEEGLKDCYSKFFGTLRNVYKFFVLYANMDHLDGKTIENFEVSEVPELDRWILSRYNRLVRDVTDYMDHYDHMKTVRAIQDFVQDDLSNWYIRRARRRFYGDMTDDKKSVYKTSYEVLLGLVRMMAPIAPFITDEMYKKLTGDSSLTVHTAYFPECDPSKIDENEEERMELVKTIVSLGRGIRESENIKVRQPLQEVLVDGKYRDRIQDLTPLIQEELNVKDVIFAEDISKFMNLSLLPNFRAAGPVLGKKIGAFKKTLSELDADSFEKEMSKNGKVVLSLNGEDTEITKDLVDIRIHAKEGFAVSMENGVFAILDTEITPALAEEGIVREVISKVQQLRKKYDFEMLDHIKIHISADDAVKSAVEKFDDTIRKETLADWISFADDMNPIDLEELENVDINGHKTGLDVVKIG